MLFNVKFLVLRTINTGDAAFFSVIFPFSFNDMFFSSDKSKSIGGLLGNNVIVQNINFLLEWGRNFVYKC